MCKRFEGHSKQAYGIIFVDEVDKLAAKGSDSRTAYNRGTQHSLLKLIEGIDVEVERETVNTGDLLFIFGGAFTGLRKQEEKTLYRPVGFMRQAEVHQEEEQAIFTESFIRYGMEAELMGRIGQRVPLEALGAEDLKTILLYSRLSLYQQYRQIFRQRGVVWEFSEKQMDDLIQQALDFGTGARASNALVEEAVAPLLLQLAAGDLQKERVVYVE